jgi:hypothetical protein
LVRHAATGFGCLPPIARAISAPALKITIKTNEDRTNRRIIMVGAYRNAPNPSTVDYPPLV